MTARFRLTRAYIDLGRAGRRRWPAGAEGHLVKEPAATGGEARVPERGRGLAACAAPAPRRRATEADPLVAEVQALAATVARLGLGRLPALIERRSREDVTFGTQAHAIDGLRADVEQSLAALGRMIDAAQDLLRAGRVPGPALGALRARIRVEAAACGRRLEALMGALEASGCLPEAGGDEAAG
ncbi:hypothetical protein OPKNFCMD_3728 [Methylobacterium crusticola]|uniref:HAMP domain-containing protein n=1 Tax=Methylobacterium crusticola TaxID=1697972 RepID=A0ABQ4R2J3_9HYPH|nr:hypothetical protein [Methylobacterium crusticola]GJD50977.1 hypothetical protein OPKNFCMD_3728 [Methylobacterium crusticola]